jgi:2-oxoglutarate ferredoxin oxidoreductase subunit beta
MICWIHDEKDFLQGPDPGPDVRRPADRRAPAQALSASFYQTDRPCYEDMLNLQVEEVSAAVRGEGDLDKLLRGSETWTIA